MPQQAAPSPKKFPLSIRLRPDPERNRVHVEVRASASPELLGAFTRQDAFAPIEGLKVADSAGEVPAAFAPTATELKLSRAPQGTVTVSYEVVAQSRVRRDVNDVVAHWDIFLAPSESLLLIPTQLPAGEVQVELDAKTIYNAGGSTLGAGMSFERKLSVQQLRHITWIAGNLGTGTLDHFIERDVGLWTPTAAHDSRGLLSEAAMVRSSMGQFFAMPDRTPFTYLFVSYRRGGGSVVSQRRAGGMVAWMDANQRWDGRLRMSIAQQLAYHWIGELLWVGPDDPEHEAESYWFVEGFVRYYARELLFRFGVLEPSEYLDELRALGAEMATNPLRDKSNGELARASRLEPRALAMLRARGALYATLLDAQIRKASQGKKRLDAVVAAMLKEGQGTHRTVPVSAFVDKLRAELGPAADRDYDRLIVKGERLELPPDALGPCFPSVSVKYPIEAPGFDPDATLASAAHKVAGLTEGGAAAKAGLRADDTVAEIRPATAASEGKMQVVVMREEKPVTLSFSTVVGTATGQGWKREPRIKDDRCVL